MAKTYLDYFRELSAIPHGSGNTRAIADYCEAFARARGLSCTRDGTNNLILRKNATNGSAETVILQGHLDMVCVQRPGGSFDFSADALKLRQEGDFLFAEGTSLGGDDGIAVAYALAILDSSTIRHPNLEVVLTSDEEIGMLGAAALDMSPLEGTMLINVDSEEEGLLLTSCAGGVRAELTFRGETVAPQGRFLKVTLQGLAGGHSGTEIDKNRQNAIVTLAKLLAASNMLGLASMDGGSADNAIPTSCTAVVKAEDGFTQRLQTLFETQKSAFSPEDRDAALTVEEAGAQEAFSPQDSLRLLHLIATAPNGVIAMSEHVEGLVQTSLNLGTIKTTGSEVRLVHALRSSVEDEKRLLLQALTAHAAAHGAELCATGDYPAWEFNPQSRLRETFQRCYRRQYGKDMRLSAIHAGLECGIFCGKKPGLDCVSMGPDIFDIHTSDERLSLSSAERTFKLLCSVLSEL